MYLQVSETKKFSLASLVLSFIALALKCMSTQYGHHNELITLGA